jgi:hypothetical protein
MLTELINLRSLLAPMAWSNAALRRQRSWVAGPGGVGDNFRIADDSPRSVVYGLPVAQRFLNRNREGQSDKQRVRGTR